MQYKVSLREVERVAIAISILNMKTWHEYCYTKYGQQQRRSAISIGNGLTDVSPPASTLLAFYFPITKKGRTVRRSINKKGTTIRWFANWQLQQSQRDETTRDLQSILNKNHFTRRFADWVLRSIRDETTCNLESILNKKHFTWHFAD